MLTGTPTVEIKSITLGVGLACLQWGKRAGQGERVSGNRGCAKIIFRCMVKIGSKESMANTRLNLKIKSPLRLAQRVPWHAMPRSAGLSFWGLFWVIYNG